MDAGRCAEVVAFLRGGASATWSESAAAKYRDAAEALEEMRAALAPFAAFFAHLTESDRLRGRARAAEKLLTLELVPGRRPVSITRTSLRRASEALGHAR